MIKSRIVVLKSGLESVVAELELRRDERT